jgi:EmrB/QacA subfamily drug resistance transporter
MPSEKKHTNKTALLIMFSISGFLTPFIAGSLNLALPSIGKEFNMNVVSIGWIATAFLLSATVFLLPFGRLADIYGRKKIYIIGSSLFALTSFLSIFAWSGTYLITVRIIQGMSCAMLWGTSTAILISVFPANERGKAIGYNVSAVYLGSSLGPVLGGMMTQNWGWRSIFYLTTALGLTVVIMCFRLLKQEWKEAQGEKFDYPGSLMYAVSIILLLYGSTLFPDWKGYAFTFSGIILFILFSIYEDRLEHPVFNIDILLKNKLFALSNLAALLNYCAAFALPFLLSLYLQYVKGLQPQDAGFVLLASPIMMMLASPFAGRLSDSRNPGAVASIGMGMVAIALFVFSIIIGTTTSKITIISLLMLFGTGLGLFSSPNTNAAMSALHTKNLGVGSSILSTMRTFGQMLSMGISMFILTIVVGKVKISPQVLPPFISATRISCLVFGILSVAGVFASLSRIRSK